MKRQLLTGLGMIEFGALAVLWRSTKAASLVQDQLGRSAAPRQIRRRNNDDRSTARSV